MPKEKTTLEIIKEATERVRKRPAWMKIGSNNTWRDQRNIRRKNV